MNVARKQILRQVEQKVVLSAKPKLHLDKRTISHSSSSSISAFDNIRQTTHSKHGEHYQEKGNTAIFSEVVDKLWQNYKLRVPDAAKYSNLVESQGGSFAFDHIAFRTLGLREKESGIELFKRILEPFGYQECSSNPFPQHNLTAVHFEMKPSEMELAHIYPKILVTQLEVDDLPTNAQNLIKDTVLHHTGAFGNHERSMLDKTTLDILEIMKYSGRHLKFVEKEYIFSNLVHLFHYVPWGMISKDALNSVNSISKYAAWCMLFGYHPHHFSALINSQRVSTMNTLENTLEMCKKVGLKFGGTTATRDILKQSSTETVQLPVGVSVMKGKEEHIDVVKYPYSYFEIIERGTIYDNHGRPQGLYGGFVEDNTLAFICNPENIPIEKRDLPPSHQKHQKRPHKPAFLPFI